MPELVLSILSAIRVFFQDRGDPALESPRPPTAIGSSPSPATTASFERPGRGSSGLPCPASGPAGRMSSRSSKPRPLSAASGWFPSLWRWHCRARGGRPNITEEIRAFIHQMARENAGWGAPRLRRLRCRVAGAGTRFRLASLPCSLVAMESTRIFPNSLNVEAFSFHRLNPFTTAGSQPNSPLLAFDRPPGIGLTLG